MWYLILHSHHIMEHCRLPTLRHPSALRYFLSIGLFKSRDCWSLQPVRKLHSPAVRYQRWRRQRLHYQHNITEKESGELSDVCLLHTAAVSSDCVGQGYGKHRFAGTCISSFSPSSCVLEYIHDHLWCIDVVEYQWKVSWLPYLPIRNVIAVSDAATHFCEVLESDKIRLSSE